MSALGWAIVLSLPVYAVIQLIAVVALGRRLELDDDPPFVDSWGITEPSDNRPVGICRACGTDNDPIFTYCSQCLTRLRPR